MRIIKGIAFDLEGTIIDIEKVHFDAFCLACRDLGFKMTLETMIREIPRALGGGDTLNSEGLARMSDGKATAKQIKERKKARYEELILTAQIKPRDGFWEIFREIKKLGLKTAIGSLTPAKQANYLLKKSGLSSLCNFDAIVLLEDVKNKKPAPDVYLETAKQMGIFPEEQLVFGDSTSDVLASKAANSKAIIIPVYKKSLEELKKEKPWRIFRSWRDIKLVKILE